MGKAGNQLSALVLGELCLPPALDNATWGHRISLGQVTTNEPWLRVFPDLPGALTEISKLVEVSYVAFPPHQWQPQPWALLQRAVSFPSATSKVAREMNGQS